MTTSHVQEIVVGVDGSAAADAALDWAIEETALRGQPLAVLRAEDPLSLPAVTLSGVVLPHVTSGTAQLRLAGLAEEALDKALARTGQSPEAHVAGVVDSPPAVLVDAADTAALVVVGRRGGGRLRHLLLGSVASALVHHALGPVAVVPDTGTQPGSGRVVVGWDGSAAARSAVRLAALEAERRGATLEIVFAWQVMTVLPALDTEPGYAPPLAELEAVAERVLAAARAEVASGPSRPEVVTRSLHGAAARALLEAAAGAELVVVGARGTGGFADLLLGSVSTAVTRHAACPVVVVRAGEERLPTSERGRSGDDLRRG